MIGFYDYTVILTYISFASSISGIFLATRGHFNWAIFCLAFSGQCDMFDGKLRGRRKTGPKMKAVRHSDRFALRCGLFRRLSDRALL